MPAAIITTASITARKYVGRKNAKRIPHPNDRIIKPSIFKSEFCPHIFRNLPDKVSFSTVYVFYEKVLF